MNRLRWLAIALLVLWGQLFLRLSLEWSYNAQYNYGWLVPLLGCYLIYIQWKERPNPGNAILPFFAQVLLYGALVLLLPIGILEEANPDWRLLSWIHALLVLFITLCVANLGGGKQWIGWFAWAFAFLLVAVPWPTSLENNVVQGLMRLVAVITAELANWFGIPAVPRGNLIDLPGGTLGVSEACSGVRSIQASVMCCAFFALLYGIRLNRAWILWAIGIGSAVVFNIGRTFFLTFTAANKGLNSVELVHDPAGHLLVVVIFGICWLTARWLGGVPAYSQRSDGLGGSVSLPVLLGIPLWVLLSSAVTELWYRSASHSAPPEPPWELRVPPSAEKPQSIPSEARAILRCDSSLATHYRAPDGSRWSLFYLTWNPGSAVAQLARSHSPEICLPAAGISLRQRATPIDLKLDGNEGILRFDRYIFEQRGRPIFVFYCVWEPVTAAAEQGEFDPSAMYDRSNRIRAAMERRRLLGQRVIEVAVDGLPTLEAATQSVQEYLPFWLHSQ